MSEKSTPNKKAIPSSLRFPANNLETCLNKIKELFDKVSNASFSFSEIISHLEIPTGSSGESLLASFKYYGLLEKTWTGQLKISDLIIDYCISGELNQEIISKILHSVPVNKKIFSNYELDNLPSDNELKNFLFKTCSYSIKQANNYMETFNKNLNFYQKHKQQSNEVAIRQALQPSYDTATSLGLDIQELLNEKVKALSRIYSTAASTITYPLSSNQEIVISLPKDIKETDLSDLEDIRDILELVLKKVNNQIDKKG